MKSYDPRNLSQEFRSVSDEVQLAMGTRDLLLPEVEHEVKQTWRTTAERALFAAPPDELRHYASCVGLVCTTPDGEKPRGKNPCEPT